MTAAMTKPTWAVKKLPLQGCLQLGPLMRGTPLVSANRLPGPTINAPRRQFRLPFAARCCNVISIAAKCRGCRHATFVDVHHLRAREDGGNHEPYNLLTLCGAHHRACHRGELLIEKSDSDGLRFGMRTGPCTTSG
jgi:hypothetical protein